MRGREANCFASRWGSHSQLEVGNEIILFYNPSLSVIEQAAKNLNIELIIPFCEIVKIRKFIENINF
jgi:hypothetical protein